MNKGQWLSPLALEHFYWDPSTVATYPAASSTKSELVEFESAMLLFDLLQDNGPKFC